ncbi:MAG: Flp family type IVb pilin [Blastochloris sp.]|nr:Flp family type IVb pilin [Blastochloris sp.]
MVDVDIVITKIFNYSKKLGYSQKGQTLVEYGLIIALVSITVIVVVSQLSGSIENSFSRIVSSIADATK